VIHNEAAAFDANTRERITEYTAAIPAENLALTNG
jgi:hypothetical protein